jgi:hydroxymethylpyrimidine pyrophosphatase-like HAD family hydrolase
VTGSPPPSRWLLACDLDQTLIYSRNTFRLLLGAPPPELLTVEHLEGEPLSFLTGRAAAGLRELALRTTFVPVTTRTLEQYRRVQLGLGGRYAIAANGGHLIVDGRPDPEWEAQVRERLAASGEGLAEVRLIAERLAASGSWVRTLRDADGFFLYLVATDRESIPDLRDLEVRLLAAGWTLSVQGRKVYLVPAGLTKEAALAEVLRRSGADLLAAAGDSLLDRGMLSLADASVRPAHGELHEQRFHLPGMRMSARAGLLGGEDVVDLLRAIVGTDAVAASFPGARRVISAENGH